MDKMVLPHPALDFFKSDHRPYYIATAEWTQQSAGTRVTFQLCHALNELGYEAYVAAQKPTAHLRTPLLTPEIIERHKAQGRKTIGVYTELMWGNTFETDVVVKWMTNREGLYSNAKHDAEAMYFYHSRGYAPNDEEKILTISPVDPSVFHNKGVCDGQRSGFAYYAYKYLKEGRGILPEKFTAKGISLCQDIPRSHEEIADILRSIKVLYVYEDTALAGEAALCGCPVVRVKTDFLAGLERNFDPVEPVMEESEIDVDVDFVADYSLRELYDKKFKDTYVQLADFIACTQASEKYHSQRDPLLSYCKEHKKVFLYGNGIVGGMVFNALKVKGVVIDGFVVSNEKMDTNNRGYCGVPVFTLSRFIEEYDDNCGVILSMTMANSMQVIPRLKALGVKYFY